MIAVQRHSTADEQARRLAELLRRELRASHPANEPRAVMLAGGRTPLAAYDLLAAEPFPVSHAAFFLLSDERMVPSHSADSNFAHVAPLFASLGVARHHLMLVDTGQTAEAAARQYGEEIERFFAQGGRVTLGLLGLGADGHTASLFSPADLARGKDSFAVAVARPDGRAGVSVTPRLLQRVERLVFVVAGESKREAVRKLLCEPSSIPAGLAAAEHPRVELWTDEAACPP